MPAGIQELRDYQKECIDVVNSLPDGSRTVVALATGLGKTLVAASLDFHGRVLWLSHRDELVYQPEKYFSARGMSFGVEKAGKTSNCEDVVSASIQSISRDYRKWLKSAMAEERSRMNLSEVTKANWEQIKSRAEKSLTAAADSQQCG